MQTNRMPYSVPSPLATELQAEPAFPAMKHTRNDCLDPAVIMPAPGAVHPAVQGFSSVFS